MAEILETRPTNQPTDQPTNFSCIFIHGFLSLCAISNPVNKNETATVFRGRKDEDNTISEDDFSFLILRFLRIFLPGLKEVRRAVSGKSGFLDGG